MAPNVISTAPTGVLSEDDSIDYSSPNVEQSNKTIKRKTPLRIVWKNVILFSLLHLSSFYGLYLSFTSAKIITLVFAYLTYVVSALGITAGAHRLWSHKAYKAKWPLRFVLMIFNTMAFQNSIWEWSRDHRVHHKYSETDADPHNAKNGLFFSHIGWLLVRKHPDVIAKGKDIDISDLENDPIVAFQKKYYLILMPFFCFILPTLIPVFCWEETWASAFFVPTILRYTITLNMTWMVNSFAHFFGSKPYDKTLNPAENLLVSLGTIGEGWHNYHHVFPWDYKAAELGNYRVNFTTLFIDVMAKIGLAYDLKTVSPSMIVRRAERTGDGSYVISKQYEKLFKHSHEGGFWGWDDKSIKDEDREATIILKNGKGCKSN